MSASSAPSGAHTGPPGGGLRGGSAGGPGGVSAGPPGASTGASFLNPPEPADPGVRKLYRSSEGRMVGGVARGLAGHLGLPVLWVRVLFLVLAAFNGIGVLLYAV